MHHVLIVMGSQRESIKLLPLYSALERVGFSLLMCAPLRRHSIVEQALKLFSIKPDIEVSYDYSRAEYSLMTPGILKELEEIIDHHKLSLMLVEGDNGMSVAAALAAFYHQIPVGYLEHGFRGKEGHGHACREMHRRFMHLMATYHFASTPAVAAQILAQGIRRDAVFCVGNMYTDLLKILNAKIAARDIIVSSDIQQRLAELPMGKMRRLLVSLDVEKLTQTELREVLNGLRKMLDAVHDLCIVFACENESTMEQVSETMLYIHDRFYVFSPLTYQDHIAMLGSCDAVVTNSSYVHEEAVCLDKPVILMHVAPDRVETQWAGLTYITGTEPQKMVDALEQIIKHYKPGKGPVLYGHGTTAERIAQIIAARFSPTLIKNYKREFIG